MTSRNARPDSAFYCTSLIVAKQPNREVSRAASTHVHYRLHRATKQALTHIRVSKLPCPAPAAPTVSKPVGPPDPSLAPTHLLQYTYINYDCMHEQTPSVLARPFVSGSGGRAIPSVELSLRNAAVPGASGTSIPLPSSAFQRNRPAACAALIARRFPSARDMKSSGGRSECSEM